ASLPTTRQAGVRRGANAACRTADLAHTRLCHACGRARNHSLRLGTIPEVHADASATGKIRDISSLRRLQMRKTAMYFISLLFLGAVLMALAQNPPQQTPQGQSTPGQQAGRGGAQPAPTPPGPNPNSQYRLGPDSMPQEGVPKGEIRGPYTLPSNAYPGTQHTYWVYVPAQYDPAVPAALMVFQDGQAFKDENGDMHAHHVMDNLIYRREIPVMIGVFINPGRTPEQPEPNLQQWGDQTTNRPTEYNTLDDKYARVITEELMPALYKEYNISKDPEMHGIGGSSSGAIAAF